MFFDFSRGLKAAESKCKDLENRLKEKEEGEALIIFWKRSCKRNDACGQHASYCCALFVDVCEVCVGRNKA